MENEDKIEWDLFGKDVSESTYNVQREIVKRVQSLYGVGTDYFYPKEFIKEGRLEKLIDFVDCKKGSTRSSYYKTVRKYLSRVNGIPMSISNRLYKLFKESERIHEDELGRKEIRQFNEIYNSLMSCVRELKRRDKSIRILIAFICKNKEIPWEKNYGVLRYHDYINTRLCEDDGKHSYFNIETGEWLIRKECTKNRCERRINVPIELCIYIKEIYRNRLPKWLLVDGKGNRYNNSSYLNMVFKKKTGYTMTEIRNSYVRYLHGNVEEGLCSEIARRMGHTLTTAIKDYT